MEPRSIVAALLIGVPLIEIYLFIEVGRAIGAWPTIGLVILTAIAGVALLRVQGVLTLRRARISLDRQELPAFELLEGLTLLIAGALLLTPGFFTDAVGFLLLWPASRRALLGALKPRMHMVARPSPHPRASGVRVKGGRIIDGEYTRKPDD
jgi:UPF0716 protein FxsA